MYLVSKYAFPEEEAEKNWDSEVECSLKMPYHILMLNYSGGSGILQTRLANPHLLFGGILSLRKTA